MTEYKYNIFYLAAKPVKRVRPVVTPVLKRKILVIKVRAVHVTDRP